MGSGSNSKIIKLKNNIYSSINAGSCWLRDHASYSRTQQPTARPAPSCSTRRLIFESARATHASAFLLALPGPDTTLSDSEFRDALWLRFGLPCAEGHSECKPEAHQDPLGLHRLGCVRAAGARIRRHDEMVSVIAKTALSADPTSFRVAREEHLPDDLITNSRPGDVALNLGDGRTYADLTVANPFAAARANASRLAGSPAAAAVQAYDFKSRKWQALLEETGVPPEFATSRFVPLAVTALGAWDERSLLWLKRFSAVCAGASGEDVGQAFASLMTRLSVALWRGNSRMIRALRAVPTIDNADAAQRARSEGPPCVDDDDSDLSAPGCEPPELW